MNNVCSLVCIPKFIEVSVTDTCSCFNDRNPCILAYGDSWEDIIVAFNSRMTPARLEVPVGKYTVVCKDGVIDVRGLGTQTGSEVIIPGQSALIMYK